MEVGTLPLVTCIRYNSGLVHFQKLTANSWKAQDFKEQSACSYINNAEAACWGCRHYLRFWCVLLLVVGVLSVSDL